MSFKITEKLHMVHVLSWKLLGLRNSYFGYTLITTRSASGINLFHHRTTSNTYYSAIFSWLSWIFWEQKKKGQTKKEKKTTKCEVKRFNRANVAEKILTSYRVSSCSKEKKIGNKSFLDLENLGSSEILEHFFFFFF